MNAPETPSHEAQAALKSALGKLAESFAEVHERLIDLRLVEEGDGSCTRCECAQFHSTPPHLICKTPHCGHHFKQHRVF